MSISTVKAALAETLAGVTGLTSIYTTAPANLDNAELPALVIFAGAGQWQRTGLNQPMVEERRTYLLNLYVQAVQAGAYGEAEAAVEPFLSRIPAALGLAPRLGETSVLLATLTADKGISVMPYGGVEYLGVEFTVEVEMV